MTHINKFMMLIMVVSSFKKCNAHIYIVKNEIYSA